MDLPDALAAEGAVTCVVGAGGKKSTLYALAERLERAVVTATVRIPPFEEQVADLRVTESPLEAVRSAERWPIGVVPAQERPDRYLGYETDALDAFVNSLSPSLEGGDETAGVSVVVKADGARTRWFKAPKETEPQLPATADVVVPVASAKIVGESLTDEHVHRPERVAAVTGLEPGDPISAADVATVLTSDDGGFKGVPDGATVIPLVNMVDTPALEETAREVAAEIHDRRAVPRVVLTRLIDDDPVVDVVRG
ncbi:selenium cofactor biosynthesis protein YqeC [Natronolimnohabitans innermongolicus]|uniref:Anaerobic dehydrogenase n=1 Tax=Natronolimnohabitans innermongolicus JCM 12255 TaxID=1227499 RepID=L9WVD4_9EURY|nr:selenium cofactor biosynthesis protein YqeC [Natronolimnohabitans innermongolicus]ELY53415.1 anaerobic dehydrogenase [Natronolimnohabitans innermongolicus JCM 12255]